MDNRMTFKQYRRMDLFIFSVLTVLFEGLATLATSKWFAGQPIAISLTLTLTLIVMHRWSLYAAIIAAVGGAVFCFASGASIEHYLIYSGGNLFALSSLVYFRLFGKETVKGSAPKTLIFILTAYVSTALGRWLISLPFGSGFGELVAFLTTDVISLLFAVIVLWTFRSVDGLIEDQKHYLLRINREEEEKRQSYIDE
jgi:hypothetical protein